MVAICVLFAFKFTSPLCNVSHLCEVLSTCRKWYAASFQAFHDHVSHETYKHHTSTVTCSESKLKNRWKYYFISNMILGHEYTGSASLVTWNIAIPELDVFSAANMHFWFCMLPFLVPFHGSEKKRVNHALFSTSQGLKQKSQMNIPDLKGGGGGEGGGAKGCLCSATTQLLQVVLQVPYKFLTKYCSCDRIDTQTLKWFSEKCLLWMFSGHQEQCQFSCMDSVLSGHVFIFLAVSWVVQLNCTLLLMSRMYWKFILHLGDNINYYYYYQNLFCQKSETTIYTVFWSSTLLIQ